MKVLALVSATILPKTRCQFYICTFAFSSVYVGITFSRTCTLMSTQQWCPWWAFSECLVLRQKMTWSKPVSVMFLAVHSSLGAEGILKVFLCFHGQQLRALECLVSHECKPLRFSKLDSSSTSRQWICSSLITAHASSTVEGWSDCMNHWLWLL